MNIVILPLLASRRYVAKLASLFLDKGMKLLLLLCLLAVVYCQDGCLQTTITEHTNDINGACGSITVLSDVSLCMHVDEYVCHMLLMFRSMPSAAIVPV